ncbi:hypothetical protein C0J52_11980 [Blattella germanica]|nr:hypothetical protein C0J52_11980 [Blattella germanica]
MLTSYISSNCFTFTGTFMLTKIQDFSQCFVHPAGTKILVLKICFPEWVHLPQESLNALVLSMP